MTRHDHGGGRLGAEHVPAAQTRGSREVCSALGRGCLHSGRLVFNGSASDVGAGRGLCRQEQQPLLSLHLFLLPNASPSFCEVPSSPPSPLSLPYVPLGGHFVTGDHAMSPVAGNLLHHLLLMVCILSYYKALLSRPGSSAGAHRDSKVESPQGLHASRPPAGNQVAFRCIFRMPTRGRPRPPKSGQGRSIEARRRRCCLNHELGAR